MGDRIAGVASVKANGIDIEAKGGWTVGTSGFVREGIAGQSGVHGYKEMPRIGFIEGTVSTMRGGRVQDLKDLTDATVMLEAANGTTWVAVNAWQAGELDVNSEEGEFTLRFEARTVRELV